MRKATQLPSLIQTPKLSRGSHKIFRDAALLDLAWTAILSNRRASKTPTLSLQYPAVITNIIAARVARETFHVERVVARIYDPERAFVYERLGIPTVATVKRTTESVLRRLMPPDAAVTWTHPSGLVSLVTATPIADWYGISFPTVETLTGERIAFVSRLGTILPARPELVIQEYDQLYFAISGEDPLPLRDILTRAPRKED